jgi:hypothetical protein
MRRVLRVGLIAGAGLVLASFSPALSFSHAALAMLDPVRQAIALCAGKAGNPVLTQELTLAAAIAGPLGAGERAGMAAMPLYPDLAVSRFPVTTASDAARRYFNQGLMLNYGFNHGGAVRSFREAQRLDPGCALCWWGEAVALGPNINAPMDDRDRGAALAAMDKARALRSGGSPMEQGLIDAVSRRYARDAGADRAGLDAAYADAMVEVAGRFPANDDVAVLAAEAVMDTSPSVYPFDGKQRRSAPGRGSGRPAGAAAGAERGASGAHAGAYL